MTRTLLTKAFGSAVNRVFFHRATTKGCSPTGFGTANKGLAGAGVALPQDALAGATSPAGMLFVGSRLDIGVGIFAPDRGFTADNNAGPPPMAPGDPSSVPPGSYDSRNDFSLTPHAGWNRMLDEHSSIGILLGANGGMNTDYSSDIWRNFNYMVGTASSPTGVDFDQLFVGVPFARALNKRHTVGIMPIVALQRFRAEGLEPFQTLSSGPTLRAGMSHADQLFDNGEALFNVLAPATVRTHASLGFTYRLAEGNSLSLAYTLAFNEKISGSNPGFTGPQAGSVCMDQHELELSWTWHFD